MITLLGCVVAHQFVAQLSVSPWWVPDLTLVGSVLATTRTPAKWLLFAGTAGLLTMVWALRLPTVVLVEYLLLGGVIRWLSGHWDVADRRLQGMIAGAASVVMTLIQLRIAHLWSFPVAGLVSVHVAGTVVAIVVVGRLREPLTPTGAGRQRSTRRMLAPTPRRRE
ncbi:MAG: hypothetical protein HYZ91_02920 [Candidatus Omnitrophica bacterium]|nr:hypothetical protein [Candidatus Omnitrophota bacterium]